MKLKKLGTGQHYVPIPKALIDWGIIDPDKKYTIILQEDDNDLAVAFRGKKTSIGVETNKNREIMPSIGADLRTTDLGFLPSKIEGKRICIEM